jgi:hypothetical protein
MKRTIMVLAAVLVAAALAVPAALATGTGVSSTLNVTSAEQTGTCVGGNQAYTIHGVLTVMNGDTLPATITGADWAAKGSSPAGDFSAAATATSNPVLTGSTIAGGSSATYDITAVTSVPCDATSAQLCVNVNYLEGTATQGSCSACAPFITNGTVVPTGTIGLLGLTLVLGAGLAVFQVRSRRRRRIHPAESI